PAKTVKACLACGVGLFSLGESSPALLFAWRNVKKLIPTRAGSELGRRTCGPGKLAGMRALASWRRPRSHRRRADMGKYLRAIWQCRYFWLSLVRMDLRTRYRRSVLGLGWSLMHPICMTAILCVVFHKLLNIDIFDYAPHLLGGMAVWNYIVSSSSQGCIAFFQGEPYIRQCPLPLAIFPLRAVLGATFHMLIQLGVVILFVAILGMLGQREVHYMPLLHLIPSTLMLFVFCWSLSIIAG